MKASIKVFATVLLSCLLGGLFGLTTAKASAEVSSFDKTIETTILGINNENLDKGTCFVMVLSDTDYMTTEWSNTDYKWKNAEELTKFEDRVKIDPTKNNVANAALDQNLSSYNFEEYILINGETLASYSQTHSYKLVANKRTRVNTLSIDFAPGVLQTISSIELKEGCQLPTLSYGYFGTGESSCLVLTEGVTYAQYNGQWTNFTGYEEGEEYGASDKLFNLSLEKTYKTHTTTALDSFTNFFDGREVAGEVYYGDVLASSSDTQKGYLMVLRFITPIDCSRFDTLSMRVYTNGERKISVYNANGVTEQSLGEALQIFTVRGGGRYSYIDLTTALYAGEDNMVTEIVFEFGEDGNPQYDVFGDVMTDPISGVVIRDQFFFVSFHLSKNNIVTEESFAITDNDEAYDIIFRFNKTGEFDSGITLDTTKVFLNGCSLSQILYACNEATAEWRSVQSIYQINVHIPKSYTGEAQIKNSNQKYTGNNMTVMKGLIFPNGETLNKSYTCHLYTGEKIVDSELASNFKTTEVTDVKFDLADSNGNIRISIRFDRDITSAPYYHACEMETWRSTELYKAGENLYDSGISAAFISGGYKTSLLDSVLINGKTIGEWHAHDDKQPTNIQVHYGNSGLNAVDVIFAEACHDTYDALYELAQSGSGLTVEVKAGFKFMVNVRTETTKFFVFEGGRFTEQKDPEPVHVYFNGEEVLDGAHVTVDREVSKDSIYVEGVANYQVTYVVNGTDTTYTITYGNETITFVVTENISVENADAQVGCVSSAGLGAVWMTLLAVAGATMMRRKKHEEV